MLLNFKVKNFRSFGKDIQTFSLVAGQQSKHESHLIEEKNTRILKFAAMYGANASGKSNFVRAFDYVKKSLQNQTTMFRENQSNKMIEKSENTYFELELLVNNNLYSYGFEVNFDEQKIISEWLIDYTVHSKPKIIFDRVDGVICYSLNFKKNSDVATAYQVYSAEYEQNTSDLFLSYIAKKPMASSPEYKIIAGIYYVYTEIVKNVLIIYPENHVDDYENSIIQKKSELETVLESFSTGITEIDFDNITENDFWSRVPLEHRNSVRNNITELATAGRKILHEKNANQYAGLFSIANNLFFLVFGKDSEKECKYQEIIFKHGKTSFHYGDESEGTQRLIQLLSIIIDNTPNKVFFIDEIDRSLHPLLTKKFVQLFFKQKKELNQQLVITTHESRLLDFDLIRQDEIWFAEKKEDGSTEIFSLEDFNERNDRKLDKAYLDGRYGAIPVFAKDFCEDANEI